MPLRLPPSGAALPLYRRLAYGDLLTFHVLDTRQYRSLHTECDGEPLVQGYCATATDPGRTILGDEQERWLHEGLVGSATRWNVLANQIRFSPDAVGQLDRPNYVGGGDQRDGYTAYRQALQDLFTTGAVSNPVVITGDQHGNFVYDVPASSTDMRSPVVATEFLGTSVTSGGTQRRPVEVFEEELNPQLRWRNNERGYVRCTVEPGLWTSEFRAATDVDRPDGPVESRRTWVVEDGRPGAQPARGPQQ